MNPVLPIEDVQGLTDTREIAIDRVGIKDINHPIVVVNEDGSKQTSIATFSLSVDLDQSKKGTHMSRFVELLNEETVEVSAPNFKRFLQRMVSKLGSENGFIEMQFLYFIEKKAPVSGVKSLMDYQVNLSGQQIGQQIECTLEVTVPVKSLCPCSKQISDYGAHNQRSHITVGINFDKRPGLDALIKLVEAEASAELFAILKRPDEKYVTEMAYNNPKFVEDVVRDVASSLERQKNVRRYYVHAENFESIHNHSAFALIEKN